MKEDKSVDEYFARTLAIVNNMNIQGEKLEAHIIIEKMLRFVSSKFNYLVCVIEESNSTKEYSIDEL